MLSRESLDKRQHSHSRIAGRARSSKETLWSFSDYKRDGGGIVFLNLQESVNVHTFTTK